MPSAPGSASPPATDLARAAVADSIAVQQRLLEPHRLRALGEAAALISQSLDAGGKILIFGNGGSASDAAHMATELVGRFMAERRALPAIPLSSDDSALTAIANDYGFERVFARQVEAFGARGDVALGISTSGRSPNVLTGLRVARERGLVAIGLTGEDGGSLPEAVDLCLHAPATSTARIQEAHILMIHVLCEIVERGVM
jgi:D-sedoheptulose 7-phosphate isomerase